MHKINSIDIFFTVCSSVGSSTDDESKTFPAVDSCRMTVDVHQVQSKPVSGHSSSKPSLIQPKPPTHQNILSVETVTKSESVNVSDSKKAMTAPKSFPLQLAGAHHDKTIVSAQANSKLSTDTIYTKPTTTAHSITNTKRTAAEDKCKSMLMTNVHHQSKQTLPAQINPLPTIPAQARSKPMIKFSLHWHMFTII